MKTGVVTAAQIAAQPGGPLSAEYWLTRRRGETYPEWKQRMTLLRALRATRKRLDQMIRNLEGP